MGVESRHKPGCRKAADKKADCTCKAAIHRGVHYMDGKVVARSEWFPKHAQAASWMVTAKAGEPGRSVSGQVPTVSEAAVLVFAGMRGKTIRNRAGEAYSEGAIVTYESRYRCHVEDLIGHMRLDQVRGVHVRKVVTELSGKLASSTVRATMTPLMVIFRQAVLDEYCAVNPCLKLGLSAKRSTDKLVVDRDEALAMIKLLPEEVGLAWAIAFFAGLRRGELMGLTYDRIQEGQILIDRSWNTQRYVYTLPKYKKVRYAPLPKMLADRIAEHKALKGAGDTDLLFPGTARAKREGPRASDEILKQAQRIWEKAGYPKLKLHEARHSFASMMIKNGGALHVKELSMAMGHSSVAFTLDIYAELFPNTNENMVSRMNEYLDAA